MEHNSKSTFRARWTASREHSMLAWLDHTIKHREINFKETIINHLGNTLVPRQVETKLQHLWRSFGCSPPLGVDPAQWEKDAGLLAFGSPCLVRLTDEYREGIATAAQFLEDEWIAVHPLRSSSQSQSPSSSTIDVETPSPAVSHSSYEDYETPPRYVRKPLKKEAGLSAAKRKIELEEDDELGSLPPMPKKPKMEARKTFFKPRNTQHITTPKPDRKEAVSSQEHIVIYDTDAEDSIISPAAVKRERKEAPSPSIPEKTLDRVKSVFDKAVGLKPWIDPNVPEPLPSPDWSPLSPVLETGGKPTKAESISSHTIEVEVEVQSPGSESQTVNTAEAERPCNGCQMLRPIQQLQLFCANCAFELTESQLRLPSLDLQLQLKDQKLTSAISDIEDLKEQLLENVEAFAAERETVLAREKEISNLGIAARQRDSCRLWPIETVEKEHLAQVDKLNQRLDKRNYWSNFTDLDSRSRDRQAKKSIDVYFRDLFFYADDIPYRSDDEKLVDTPSMGSHPDLDELVCKVLTITTDNVDQTPLLIKRFLRLDAKMILRALANAALRDWVFETDFPGFGIDDTSETLLNYRTSVFEQDGAVALRNLDLASVATSINNPSFRNRAIPEKALELAIRFSQTVAPLFGNSTTEDWQGFATWSGECHIWVGRRSHLIEMFTLALTAKAELCLNIEDYELVSFPPGTPVDEDSINIETDTGASENTIVGFCVQPAVYTYARKELHRDALMGEALISTRNFVRKMEEERAALKPVMRAQVVVPEKRRPRVFC